MRLSKLLSYVLRHSPGSAGVRLDEAGWVDVDELLTGLAASGHVLRREDLEGIVAGDSKQRYALVGGRIRANQGHSVPVDLGLAPTVPPAVLFHGTAQRHLAAILRQGLLPMGRHDVHLSADEGAARAVGARHGTPLVLRVDAAAMTRDGRTFRRSANGVWLTEAVPPAYLDVCAATG